MNLQILIVLDSMRLIITTGDSDAESHIDEPPESTSHEDDDSSGLSIKQFMLRAAAIICFFEFF